MSTISALSLAPLPNVPFYIPLPPRLVRSRHISVEKMFLCILWTDGRYSCEKMNKNDKDVATMIEDAKDIKYHIWSCYIIDKDEFTHIMNFETNIANDQDDQDDQEKKERYIV